MDRDPATRDLAAWFAHPERPPLIVAEVAQAHDGSLGLAHSWVDAAAQAGAHAIKFQTHIAEAESTPGEPWRVRFSPQDATRYGYWTRLEWTPEQWGALKRHAEERELIFLSSPFSLAAVDLLEGLGVVGWKVASGELAHPALLERMHRTGKPVLVSSGMSPWHELDEIVARFADRPTALLQCTTSYPCPAEEVGLNLIGEMRRRYPKAIVGLSDHSGTVYPGLAAVTLGAEIVEVHVTFDRRLFGPDTSSSLTFDELARLVEGTAFISRMLRHPVDKDSAAAARADLRSIFGRSLVAARDLARGRRLVAGDLVAKKPGGGLPADATDDLLGRVLRRDLVANERISREDCE